MNMSWIIDKVSTTQEETGNEHEEIKMENIVWNTKSSICCYSTSVCTWNPMKQSPQLNQDMIIYSNQTTGYEAT
jgi:hypothetical protein